jgi:hypothetical protein
LIIKFADIQKNEDNLKNIIGLCKETSKYKEHFLFNEYRYFPLILNLRYGHPKHNDNEYEVVGNKTLVSKEFMNQFTIDNKMFENIGIYQISGKSYPRTFYSLGIGCIEYVNGIHNFMSNNHCCFYDSGVLEQGKTYGFSYRIKKGDTVMLELDTSKRTLYFFVNKKIQPVVLTDVPLPMCF